MAPRRSACVRPATAASPAIEASRRSPSVKPSFRPIVTASSGCPSRGTIPNARSLPLTCSRARRRRGALDGRIAIIGTSAPGLLDLRATPLDPVISGVEINAQALEQLLSKRLLVRPDYAVGMEIVLAVASALLLGLMVYRWGARVSAAVGFATVCLFSLGSLWAFSRGLLLDAVFPIMTSSAAYIFGTGYLYYEAESERNRGRETLQRIAREMEAAAQIQRTFLPKEAPTGPFGSKFEIFAIMKPAKAVGGDFYDYFLIDDRKLALAVGDVSGKGVPAALFMSVSRTVLAHHRLRGRGARARSIEGQRDPVARQYRGHVRHDLLRRARPRYGQPRLLERGARRRAAADRCKRLRAVGLYGTGDRPDR